jgi:hypothetical protein
MLGICIAVAGLIIGIICAIVVFAILIYRCNPCKCDKCGWRGGVEEVGDFNRCPECESKILLP